MLSKMDSFYNIKPGFNKISELSNSSLYFPNQNKQPVPKTIFILWTRFVSHFLNTILRLMSSGKNSEAELIINHFKGLSINHVFKSKMLGSSDVNAINNLGP